ncbi:MAG: S8 family serine peptidase [Patescibacteria group bacterium]
MEKKIDHVLGIVCVFAFLTFLCGLNLKSIEAADQGKRSQVATSMKERLFEEGVQPRGRNSDSQKKDAHRSEGEKNIPTLRSAAEERKSEDNDELIMLLIPQKLNDSNADKVVNTIGDSIRDGKSVTVSESKKTGTLIVVIDEGKNELDTYTTQLGDLDGVAISENRRYTISGTPNDTYYSNQWYLTNINYDQAYDYGKGPYATVIAVLDNGVNTAESDLSGQFWVNTGETAGNGIDDDGNGYIDDVNGCNFYKYNNGPIATRDESCLASSMYTAGSNHGTDTALLMASKTNNNFGMSSVCPGCKIMILDIDDTGGAALTEIVDAINYAIDEGADVINFSYASACPFDTSSDGVMQTLLNTLINTEQIAFVQSAGNYGSRTQSECTDECGANTYCSTEARNSTYYYIDGKEVANKINVAATNSSNKRASFSNYDGTAEDATSIAAPGDSLPIFRNGSLTTINGTSYASPIVAGTLGLILNHTKGDLNPTTNQLYTYLRSTATPISTTKDISGKKVNMYSFLVEMITQQNGLTGQAAVYRFYSPLFQSYFYTPGDEEAQYVRNTYPDSTWTYQGIGYYSFINSATERIPVYRFWSEKFKVHFYTSSSSERDSVDAQYSDNIWKYEGIAMYVYSPAFGGSRKPVYRFWSDTYQTHFYTASESEKTQFQANTSKWRYEGIAWYVPNR